ncbi:MAG: hypothetical protein ABSC06_12845 [Rhodopila sp.]|jgi:hypothetical protein
MLRVRSGEGRAVEPPTVDQTALAEIGKMIADARAEMSRLIQLGELQHDPIRHPIQALSVHLDALYKLSVESSRAVARLTEASRNPISDEDVRRLADLAFQQLDERLASRMVEFNKAAIAIGVVAALAAAAVGFGVGWFGRGAPPVVQCVEQNGGRVCFDWNQPPAPAQAPPASPQQAR